MPFGCTAGAREDLRKNRSFCYAQDMKVMVNGTNTSGKTEIQLLAGHDVTISRNHYIPPLLHRPKKKDSKPTSKSMLLNGLEVQF